MFFEYRTDANNNRTFCTNHIHLVTAEIELKNEFYLNLLLKLSSLATASEANRGLENSNNRGYYWRIYGIQKQKRSLHGTPKQFKSTLLSRAALLMLTAKNIVAHCTVSVFYGLLKE